MFVLDWERRRVSSSSLIVVSDVTRETAADCEFSMDAEIKNETNFLQHNTHDCEIDPRVMASLVVLKF